MTNRYEAWRTLGMWYEAQSGMRRMKELGELT